MSEKYYTNKIFITMQELMDQLDISDKTLSRMIQEGELPDFSYGSNSTWCRKKGWHVAVLERHAMEKYERSKSIRNACNPIQITTEDMTVMSLRRTPQQRTDIDDGKKQSSKKKSNRKIPSYIHSRVAAGFTELPISPLPCHST